MNFFRSVSSNMIADKMADKVMRSLDMAVACGKHNPSHDFPLTMLGVPRHYTQCISHPKCFTDIGY